MYILPKEESWTEGIFLTHTELRDHQQSNGLSLRWWAAHSRHVRAPPRPSLPSAAVQHVRCHFTSTFNSASPGALRPVQYPSLVRNNRQKMCETLSRATWSRVKLEFRLFKGLRTPLFFFFFYTHTHIHTHYATPSPLLPNSNIRQKWQWIWRGRGFNLPHKGLPKP